MRDPSNILTPLYSQLTLRIYAAKNGWMGAPKLALSPGAGNPTSATTGAHW